MICPNCRTGEWLTVPAGGMVSTPYGNKVLRYVCARCGQVVKA